VIEHRALVTCAGDHDLENYRLFTRSYVEMPLPMCNVCVVNCEVALYCR
jgi:hypothetical protein